MNICKKFPKESICPICGTNKAGKCVLIARDDKIDGFTAEAIVFHLDCIDLFYSKDNKIIYQKIY